MNGLNNNAKIMTKDDRDIKCALTTYLSASIPEEERTVRHITPILGKAFLGLTRSQVYDILHDSEVFTSRPSNDNHNVTYWYADAEKDPSWHDLDNNVYVLVDCDTSPDMFRFFTDIADSYDHLTVEGFAHESSDTLVKCFTHESMNTLDEFMRQSNYPWIGVTGCLLIDNLMSTLEVNYDATCFIVSEGEVCENLRERVEELQNKYQESDLCVGEGSDEFKTKILACL